MLDMAIIKNPNIPDISKSIYTILCNNPEAPINRSELSTWLGCCLRTVDRALAALEQAGVARPKQPTRLESITQHARDKFVSRDTTDRDKFVSSDTNVRGDKFVSRDTAYQVQSGTIEVENEDLEEEFDEKSFDELFDFIDKSDDSESEEIRIDAPKPKNNIKPQKSMIDRSGKTFSLALDEVSNLLAKPIELQTLFPQEREEVILQSEKINEDQICNNKIELNKTKKDQLSNINKNNIYNIYYNKNACACACDPSTTEYETPCRVSNKLSKGSNRLSKGFLQLKEEMIPQEQLGGPSGPLRGDYRRVSNGSEVSKSGGEAHNQRLYAGCSAVEGVACRSESKESGGRSAKRGFIHPSGKRYSVYASNLGDKRGNLRAATLSDCDGRAENKNVYGLRFSRSSRVATTDSVSLEARSSYSADSRSDNTACVCAVSQAHTEKDSRRKSKTARKTSGIGIGADSKICQQFSRRVVGACKIGTKKSVHVRSTSGPKKTKNRKNRTEKYSMATGGKIGKLQQKIIDAKLIAKKKASGKGLVNKLDPAVGMAFAYEEALSDYLYKPTLKYIKGHKLDPTMKTTAYFEQAAKMATSVGASFDDFVRAQFYWFHLWFGRKVQVHELRSKKGTFSAIARYKRYMELLKEGKAPKKVTATSTGSLSVATSTVDTINTARLKQLTELWNLTEEEALIAFVPEGIFDDAWLRSNLTYQNLKKGSRL